MPAKSIARLITAFSKTDIQALFKGARTIYKQNGLRIKCAQKSKEFGRILIVIPRAAGNAVKRNLIRRRIKAIFYQHELYAKGYDCIVLVQKEAMQLKFSDLKEIFLNIFSQQQTTILTKGTE